MSLDPISILLDIGSKVIDRVFPDPAAAASAKLELIKLQQSGDLAVMAGQMKINEIEAGNASLFVSGWRPAIGWVCGAACAWNWIGLPMVKIGLGLLAIKLELAPANLTEMMPILLGMLGLGGLRTLEKVQGVAAK
jgi:hypothetical protein